jgi:DNA-binding Lrp family transcriptional regulator
VKEEDQDWLIYHLLADPGRAGVKDLADRAEISPEKVEESLLRLEKQFLVQRKGDEYSILSIQEMMLRCQCRYDPGLPFEIENGEIKMKVRREDDHD